jgi:hypothetical protein
MTKLSGTDIGYPSDDRYCFNRIRTNMNRENLGHTPAFDEMENYYGDLVISEYWEQADPNKPLSVMFIYALCGGGHPNVKSLDENGEIVAGINIGVNGRRQIEGQEVWVCQTVFLWEEEDTTKCFTSRMSDPRTTGRRSER